MTFSPDRSKCGRAFLRGTFFRGKKENPSSLVLYFVALKVPRTSGRIEVTWRVLQDLTWFPALRHFLGTPFVGVCFFAAKSKSEFERGGVNHEWRRRWRSLRAQSYLPRRSMRPGIAYCSWRFRIFWRLESTTAFIFYFSFPFFLLRIGQLRTFCSNLEKMEKKEKRAFYRNLRKKENEIIIFRCISSDWLMFKTMCTTVWANK